MKELKAKVFYDSKTMKLMDEFEGLKDENDGVVYDRLVIYNENLIQYVKKGKAYNYALVVERGSNKKSVGSIVMTEFKRVYLKPYVFQVGDNESLLLSEHLKNEITEKVYEKFVDSGKVYKFNKPYELKAQNSRNRSGYGNIYNGEYLVYEGTKYGETTSYLFTGVYIYSSDGYWGRYENQWGTVKKFY